MPQGGGPAALALHGVGLVPGGHNPQECAGTEEDQRAQNLHQDDEVPGDSPDEAGGDEKGEQHPNAVDHPLDGGGCEAEREAQVVPMSQQVAANQLADAQGEHFIGEQPDVDGLHGAPEPQPDHRGKQGVPAPAVGDIDSQVGQEGDGHPPPIEGADGGHEVFDRVAVEHPHKAPDGKPVAQHLGQPGRHSAARWRVAHSLA